MLLWLHRADAAEDPTPMELYHVKIKHSKQIEITLLIYSGHLSQVPCLLPSPLHHMIYKKNSFTHTHTLVSPVSISFSLS